MWSGHSCQTKAAARQRMAMLGSGAFAAVVLVAARQCQIDYFPAISTPPACPPGQAARIALAIAFAAKSFANPARTIRKNHFDDMFGSDEPNDHVADIWFGAACSKHFIWSRTRSANSRPGWGSPY